MESPLFSALWSDYGLTDTDLARFQNELLSNPYAGPVIRNTKGVRKVRFRPAAGAKGKSGGCRVCYVFLEELSAFVLLFVYPKSEKVDLTPSDRKMIRREVDRLTALLRRRIP